MDSVRNAVHDPLYRAVYQPDPVPEPKPFVPTNSTVLANMTFRMENLTVPAADGTPLALKIYHPNEVANATPVVLLVSPYVGDPGYNNFQRLAPYAFLDMIVFSEFGYRGYAVAFAEARGSGASGGCLDYGGGLERADAATLVEWLGAQPWSNGKVALVGYEYEGFVALGGATLHPPHLAAVVAIDAWSDLYEVVAEGGAKLPRSLTFPYNMSGIVAMSTPAPETLPPADPQAIQSYAGQQITSASDPRLARAKDQACAAQAAQALEDPSGVRNAWLAERDLTPLAKDATAPLLAFHALLAPDERATHFDRFYTAYGGPKSAVLTQSTGGTTAALDGVIAALPWLDYHLMGIASGANATYSTVSVDDSLGRQRNETSWPPANATARTFVLAHGGKMDALGNASTESLAPASEVDAWKDDVTESGGALGSRTSTLNQGSGATRLVYRSDPLASDLHYAGRPLVRVNVDTDRPNALVVARLYQILPDGSWVLVNRGVRSVMLRDSLTTPSPAQPAQVYQVNVPLAPDDFVFRAGDRIGLVLAGDDAAFVLPLSDQATTTLHYGGTNASALVLPAIHDWPPLRVTWTAAQPNWRGPHAWEATP